MVAVVMITGSAVIAIACGCGGCGGLGGDGRPQWRVKTDIN
jgi:hypothetical protein